jgi:serine phosphatase RsbU (regulator of sigma subunit)
VAAPAATTVAPPVTTPSVAKPPIARHPVAQRHAEKSKPRAPLAAITHTVTRTVHDVVEVLPSWAKALIAALAGLLLLAAGLVVAAAWRNRRLRRHRAALLDEVGVLQGALLPAIPERVGELEVSVAYRPAAGLASGGDFYDVFALERGCVGIIIGDIAGHGREALKPAASVRHMVRSYMEAGLTPRAAIQLTGNVLDDQDCDEFATVAAGVHDPRAGTLSYATAGHPPPIVRGPAAYEPLVVSSSPPAGSGLTTGLRQTTIALPGGSTVCFFTDGLSEARAESGEYGRERIERALDDLGDEATAEALVDRVAKGTPDGLSDDVAVCLVHAGTGAAAASVRVEEIEVTLSDLDSPRLQRFLDACGVDPAQAEAAIRAAAPQVSGLESVLLRLRLADDRSGVDVVPVESARGDDLPQVRTIR